MIYIRKVMAISVAILTCVAIGGGSRVWSGDLTLVPSIALKQEYSDNVFFDEVDEESDFITTISPGLRLEKDTERVVYSLSTFVDGVIYDDNDDLDAVDQRYSGGIYYRVSPRMGFRGMGSYRRDSRPDRETETSGNILKGDRDRQNIGLGWEYLITELIRGELFWAYNREEIDMPDSEDNWSHKLEFKLSKNLSAWVPNTTGEAVLSYMRYESEGEDLFPGSGAGGQDLRITTNADYDVWRLAVGGSREMTETWKFSAITGMSFTEMSEDVLTEISAGGSFVTLGEEKDQNDDKLGFVIQASLSHSGEYLSGSLELTHDMQPASGDQGLSERTSLILDARRKITSDFQVSLSTGYYLNRRDGESSPDLEEHTIRISPRLRYFLDRDFYVSAAYLYTLVDNRETDEEYERNLFMVRVVKEFDLTF